MKKFKKLRLTLVMFMIAMLACASFVLAGCPTPTPDDPTPPDVPPTQHVHEYGEWEDVPGDTADCLNAGSERRVCSTCEAGTQGHEETRAKAALGHDWAEEVLTAPTYRNSGLGQRTCGNCFEEEQYTLDPLGIPEEFHGTWVSDRTDLQFIIGVEDGESYIETNMPESFVFFEADGKDGVITFLVFIDSTTATEASLEIIDGQLVFKYTYQGQQVATYYDKQGGVTPPPAPSEYTIDVTVNNTAYGTYELSAQGPYAQGDVVTLTVEAEEGYEIRRVTNNGMTIQGVDGVYTITVGNQNITIAITFGQIVLPGELSISEEYRGNWISESEDYTLVVTEDTITINGVAATNIVPDVRNWGGGETEVYAFDWDGEECILYITTGSGELCFEIETGDVWELLTAVEAAETYEVTVEINGEGGTAVLSEAGPFEEGETVTLTVTPDEGFEVEFVAANGNELTAEEDGTYVITVGTEAINVVVTFAEVATGPQLPVNPWSSGTGTSGDPFILDSIRGSYEMTIPVASSGYYTTYNFQYTAAESGTYVLYSANIPEFTRLRITRTSPNYSTIGYWDLGTNMSFDAGSTYTFRVFQDMIGGDVYGRQDLQLVFVIAIPGEMDTPSGETYNVTVEINGEGGTAELSAEGPFEEGEEVTLTVTPDEGFEVEFVAANGNELTAEEDGTYVITVGTEDINVVVTFAEVATGSQLPVNPWSSGTGTSSDPYVLDSIRGEYNMELAVSGMGYYQQYNFTYTAAEGGTYVFYSTNMPEFEYMKLTRTAPSYMTLSQWALGTEFTLDAGATYTFKVTTSAVSASNYGGAPFMLNFVIAYANEMGGPPEVETYDITVNCDSNKGSYSLGAEGPFEEGNTVTLTVTAKNGFEIATVTANGVALNGNNGTYVITVGTEDITVNVTFNEVELTPADKADFIGTWEGTSSGYNRTTYTVAITATETGIHAVLTVTPRNGTPTTHEYDLTATTTGFTGDNLTLTRNGDGLNMSGAYSCSNMSKLDTSIKAEHQGEWSGTNGDSGNTYVVKIFADAIYVNNVQVSNFRKTNSAWGEAYTFTWDGKSCELNSFNTTNRTVDLDVGKGSNNMETTRLNYIGPLSETDRPVEGGNGGGEGGGDGGQTPPVIDDSDKADYEGTWYNYDNSSKLYDVTVTVTETGLSVKLVRTSVLNNGSSTPVTRNYDLTKQADGSYKGDCTNADDSMTLTISGDTLTMKAWDVTISLAKADEEVPPVVETYEVNVEVNGQGGTAVLGEAGPFEEGETVTLTVTADEGYAVDMVVANGDPLTAEEDGTYVITVGAANVNVVVTFVEVDLPPVVLADKADFIGTWEGQVGTNFNAATYVLVITATETGIHLEFTRVPSWGSTVNRQYDLIATETGFMVEGGGMTLTLSADKTEISFSGGGYSGTVPKLVEEVVITDTYIGEWVSVSGDYEVVVTESTITINETEVTEIAEDPAGGYSFMWNEMEGWIGNVEGIVLQLGEDVWENLTVKDGGDDEGNTPEVNEDRFDFEGTWTGARGSGMMAYNYEVIVTATETGLSVIIYRTYNNTTYDRSYNLTRMEDGSYQGACVNPSDSSLTLTLIETGMNMVESGWGHNLNLTKVVEDEEIVLDPNDPRNDYIGVWTFEEGTYSYKLTVTATATGLAGTLQIWRNNNSLGTIDYNFVEDSLEGYIDTENDDSKLIINGNTLTFIDEVNGDEYEMVKEGGDDEGNDDTESSNPFVGNWVDGDGYSYVIEETETGVKVSLIGGYTIVFELEGNSEDGYTGVSDDGPTFLKFVEGTLVFNDGWDEYQLTKE